MIRMRHLAAHKIILKPDSGLSVGHHDDGLHVMLTIEAGNAHVARRLINGGFRGRKLIDGKEAQLVIFPLGDELALLAWQFVNSPFTDGCLRIARKETPES